MGIAIGFGGGGLPQNGSVQSLTATDHLAAKIATPAIGGDGEARLYAISVGGQERWAQIGGDAGAVPRRIGSSEACCLIATVYPMSGAGLSYFGCTASAVGTVAHPNLSAASLVASLRRWRCTSATTANAAADTVWSTTMCYRGDAAGRGGFTADFRFAITTTCTNIRGFVGLTPQLTAVTTSPLALTDTIGMMFESGETTWRIGSNDGSGNANRVDLGANFPVGTATALYSLSLNCEPGQSTIGYTVVRHDTSPPITVSGTLSTKLPTNTTFMTPHCGVNNGGDTAAVAIDTNHMILEIPVVRV